MKKYLLIFLASFLFAGCQPVDKRSITCRVQSIDKQIVTSGREGNISTDIYWLVVTDQGTFHVRTDGYFGCPEAASLQKDSAYTLTVDGFFQSPFLGVYPYITKVHK